MTSVVRAFLVLAVLAIGLVAGQALSAEWVAAKLRGGVFAHVAGQWIPLRLGDTVESNWVIRTQPSGHAQFVRGAETIDMRPNTQIQIEERTAAGFTTVKQWYGAIEVDVEARNVQHFAVRTPHVAAVVKGTRFVVTSGDDSSEVDVVRGRVAVECMHTYNEVALGAGQSSLSGAEVALHAWGGETVPVVYNSAGKAVATAVPDAAPMTKELPPGETRKTASQGNGNSGGNGNGNSGGNGNGNSGGNGNSNSGGNGNGNSGGNGNGNSGGNGNGNSGGNGNGKGHGNN